MIFTDDDAYDSYRERDIAPMERAAAESLVAALMTPSLPRVFVCVDCDDAKKATGWESCAHGCYFCGTPTSRYMNETPKLRSVR